MTAIHDVLRYLIARVPHSTQDEHDRIAALVDQDDPEVDQDEQDENPQTTPPAEGKKGAKSTPAKEDKH